MRRILAYYMETGKTINDSLVKKIIDMPVTQTWTSLIEESVKLNKEKIK
ncbi:hypothetical protein [Proteocatella sphenisci]|nr:hypothetical protein [Proteocatella sphenisci]